MADLPHKYLSAGLLVLMQYWAFLHRCSVLDRPNTSESVGPIDILHGTPSLQHSQSKSFNSCMKSILVLLANPFFNFCSLNFFQIESACSSSSSHCATSLVWGKGLAHYYTLPTTTEVNLCILGKLCLFETPKPRSAASPRLPTLQYPESHKMQHQHQNLAPRSNSYGRTHKKKQVLTVHE
jgi:hypothetical protein